MFRLRLSRTRRLIALAAFCGLLIACRSTHAPRPPARTGVTEGATEEMAISDGGIAYQLFPTEQAALRYVLATEHPRIVGVGEVHQSTDAAPVRSAVERFIAMLDVVAPAASDLVVETWVQTGQCGAAEQNFARDVPRSTHRPAAQEDQVRVLLREARRQGVEPHVLRLDCHDYARLTNDAGSVNLESLALLLAHQLEQVTAHLYVLRAQYDAGANAQRAVWVYGGALHNDLAPEPGNEPMSYAHDLDVLAQGRYVELDLFVPEYIRGNALDMEEPWYPLFERFAGPDHTLLIERGPRSYILIFRTGDRATMRQIDAAVVGAPATR